MASFHAGWCGMLACVLTQPNDIIEWRQMTLAWILRRMYGMWWQWHVAWTPGVCRCVLQRLTKRFHSFADRGTTRPTERCMYLIDELHTRSKEAQGMRLWSLWQRMVAHAAVDGDLAPVLWPQEAMEHAYVVDFIRQRLNVHKSDKWATDCLCLWILDIVVSHGGCIVSLSLDLKSQTSSYDFSWWCAGGKLLCYVEIFV